MSCYNAKIIPNGVLDINGVNVSLFHKGKFVLIGKRNVNRKLLKII